MVDTNMFKMSFALTAVLLGTAVQAGTDCSAEKIQERLPGVEAESVRTTPLNGVCEIAIGPQIVYVSPDAKYLVRGDIIDIESNTNLTDQRRSTARARVLDGLTEKDMIVFAPKKVQHTITVFTDIDCGYCRKLHREIAAFNDLGIKVQYLFFPRSGPDSPSWTKAQQVWCSDNRNDALTRAKNGEELETKACEAAPVASQYEMGQMVGLRGTPAIVTESGDLISGYLPAEAMLERLQSIQTARVD